MNTIRQLDSFEYHKYSDHLLRLSSEDRYLRFGAYITDEFIIEHASITNNRLVLAAFDNKLNVIAACEVNLLFSQTSTDYSCGDIGLSVEHAHRGKGLGTALFDRALTLCRNRRIKTLTSCCLTRNRFMMKIAREHGMQIDSDRGSSEGVLTLPVADLATLLGELIGHNLAIADNYNKLLRNIWLK